MRRLLDASFVCDPVGRQTLPGTVEPVLVFNVVDRNTDQGPMSAAETVLMDGDDSRELIGLSTGP